MFRKIILPIFRDTGHRPATSWVHYTTSCNTRSSVPENSCPKHIELIGIINKPLLLHLVGCLYYLYQWCTVKLISDNEIYLLIKYIKSVLSRAAKHLSYIEEARCLKFNKEWHKKREHLKTPTKIEEIQEKKILTEIEPLQLAF
jgi:hypothetical protein